MNAALGNAVRIDAFETKSLRQVLRIASRTARKANSRALERTGVERSLLKSVVKKMTFLWAYQAKRWGVFGEKEIIQGTIPGTRRRGRPDTTWLGNITSWMAALEQLCQTTSDREVWRMVIHSATKPRRSVWKCRCLACNGAYGTCSARV